MDNPNVALSEIDGKVIENTVTDMLAEQMPGTDHYTREELTELVRCIHEETKREVLSRRLRAVNATAYFWRRIVEELTVAR